MSAVKPLRAPRPGARSRRNWLPWLLALAVLAAAGFLGWWYVPRWFAGGDGKTPLTAAAQQGELKVTVTDRGELESINSLQVTCELEGGGKIVSILAEGTRVEAGDEVAKLDTDALQKLINEQEIKWETAESKVNSGRSEVALAKNKALSEIAKAALALELAEIDLEAFADPQGKYTRDRDKAKGALELARKNLNESQDDLEFTRSLVQKGFAQLDQLRTKDFAVQERKLAVTSAEADLIVLEKFTRKKDQTELRSKAGEARLELARTKDTQATAVGKAEADLKSALKTAEIENKQLERLRRQMDRCLVRAPTSGMVVYANARQWDESARIRAGAQIYFRQPIFTLPDLTRMLVKMKVHESMIKKVRLGQTATMQIDALPNRVLHGTVLKIGTLPQSDGWRGGGVKQYETEISIDDLPAEAGLKPGMTAEVKILINTLPDAITVPVQAVAEYEGASVCYVAGPGGLERREVMVGDSNDQHIQIVSGLEPGEAVALDARVRAAAQLKAAGPTARPTKAGR
jgi:RND family efflux transporter MFP subunit